MLLKKISIFIVLNYELTTISDGWLQVRASFSNNNYVNYCNAYTDRHCSKWSDALIAAASNNKKITSMSHVYYT